jgi:hypothetical protein
LAMTCQFNAKGFKTNPAIASFLAYLLLMISRKYIGLARFTKQVTLVSEKPSKCTARIVS